MELAGAVGCVGVRGRHPGGFRSVAAVDSRPSPRAGLGSFLVAWGTEAEGKGEARAGYPNPPQPGSRR